MIVEGFSTGQTEQVSIEKSQFFIEYSRLTPEESEICLNKESLYTNRFL